jgi:beta-1,4-N-acetylglucosaminyltransferase
MILTVVGSSSIRFDRLLRGLDSLQVADETVIVQRGPSLVEPPSATVVDFMPFEDMVERIREARVVITHAGVGTIFIALMNGKRPVVVPRLHRYAEAVDDHQLELGRRLADEGLVILVEDPTLLGDAVRSYEGSTDGRTLGGDGALARELRARITARVDRR